MLTPDTTAKSGRLPDAVQPIMRPAPKAPSAPPPDKASQGPVACGSRRRNSPSESPQARASGIPGIAAAACSSAVKGVRTFSFSACLGAAFGAFLEVVFLAVAFGIAFLACAYAEAATGHHDAGNGSHPAMPRTAAPMINFVAMDLECTTLPSIRTNRSNPNYHSLTH